MQDEASVRRKLDAARIMRAEKNGVPVAIYLEGVIDICEWLLCETAELPLCQHDAVSEVVAHEH